MDREAWQATVHRVTKSPTRRKQLSMSAFKNANALFQDSIQRSIKGRTLRVNVEENSNFIFILSINSVMLILIWVLIG